MSTAACVENLEERHASRDIVGRRKAI